MNPIWQRFLTICNTHALRPALKDSVSTLSYSALLKLVTALPQDHTVRWLTMPKGIPFILALLDSFRQDTPFVLISQTTFQRLDSHQIELVNNVPSGYVVFTSGSTGTPKACHLSGNGLLDVIQNQINLFNVSEKSRFCWVLNSYFDASLSDILVSLLSGACLTIPSCTPLQIRSLTQFLIDFDITHIDLPPSCLHLYNPSTFTELSTVIIGGETPDPKSLTPWLNEGISIFNAYGPTETTVCSSVSQITDPANISIGNPFAHLAYFTLDSSGLPVPFTPNITSELVIAGSGVGVGYINSALTTERFLMVNGVPHYKTGDLVLFKDNTYYFVGRKDRQFKRRGNLICPEEVEQALLQHNFKGRLSYDTILDILNLSIESSIPTDHNKIRLIIKQTFGTTMVPNTITDTPTLKLNQNFKHQ